VASVTARRAPERRLPAHLAKMVAFAASSPLAGGAPRAPHSSATAPRRPTPIMSAAPIRALVTGAAGRTGRLALQRLVSRPEFEARGLVRDRARAAAVLAEAGCVGCEDALVEGDVGDRESLRAAMRGMDAVIVLTSAVPVMLPGAEGAPPEFKFEEGGKPTEVDGDGGVNQVEIAKECGVKHVVFVGSMGSTNDAHPLNRLGNGNILRYKRRSEQFLIASGVDYTVINPGGLINDEPGRRQLVVSSNDELVKVYQKTTIPRGDVAEVAVQALLSASARNKAMDIIAKQPNEAPPTTDFDALFAAAGATL
jgi:uncharacterized protein YbjT (DUF2867 family)